MQLKVVSILSDEKGFNKFCQFEDKIFGCQTSYGCSISCPLHRAREVQELCNEKGMTIGEAHKASIRKEMTEAEAVDALRSAVIGSKTVSMGELIDALADNRKKKG